MVTVEEAVPFAFVSGLGMTAPPMETWWTMSWLVCATSAV